MKFRHSFENCWHLTWLPKPKAMLHNTVQWPFQGTGYHHTFIDNNNIQPPSPIIKKAFKKTQNLRQVFIRYFIMVAGGQSTRQAHLTSPADISSEKKGSCIHRVEQGVVQDIHGPKKRPLCQLPKATPDHPYLISNHLPSSNSTPIRVSTSIRAPDELRIYIF